MSSVQGAKKCPKCGGVMVYEFNCRTTEEYRTCLRCGYHQEWGLLRNEDGTVKTDEDGKWREEYSETIGYGAACLRSKEGIGLTYNFDKPLTEEDKAALLEDIRQPETDESSYAVLFDPQSGGFTVLAGKLPEDYEGDTDEE